MQTDEVAISGAERRWLREVLGDDTPETSHTTNDPALEAHLELTEH